MLSACPYLKSISGEFQQPTFAFCHIVRGFCIGSTMGVGEIEAMFSLNAANASLLTLISSCCRVKREEYTGKDGQMRVDTKVTVNQINRILDSMSSSYGQPMVILPSSTILPIFSCVTHGSTGCHSSLSHVLFRVPLFLLLYIASRIFSHCCFKSLCHE